MARPTPDEAALLRTICANPADDLPRLVYADWLEENGRSERAEFIRLQIGLSEYWPLSTHKRRADRIEELLKTHRKTWDRELPNWVVDRSCCGCGCCRMNYSRGFIEELTVSASPFLQFGPQLLGRVPLTSIRLYEAEKLLHKLAACPWLGHVPKLQLRYSCFQNDRFAALASSPYLQTLENLDLQCSDINDIGARALANSRFLRSLKRLDLRYNNISIGAVKMMAHSPNLQNLEQLDLLGNRQLRGHEYRIEDWFGKRVVIHDGVE